MMNSAIPPRGIVAVDKMGGKVLFLDAQTHETVQVLDNFARGPHELLVVPDQSLAYVPIYGDGIHGRNPNPGHLLSVIDLAARTHAYDIDLSPCVSPHGLKIAPDGLLYVTCEDSAVVAIIDRAARRMVGAIETGSTNAHRLAIARDGQRLYTENEEDASVSVIDLPGRKLLRKIDTPRPLAGIAISPDGGTLIAVDDEEPTLFLIDTARETVTRTLALNGLPQAAQIARYSPDGAMLLVTSLKSDRVVLLDAALETQATIVVGQQPMDACFRGDTLLVGCQGDGTVHVIDTATKQAVGHFAAGVGCESLAYF